MEFFSYLDINNLLYYWSCLLHWGFLSSFLFFTWGGGCSIEGSFNVLRNNDKTWVYLSLVRYIYWITAGHFSNPPLDYKGSMQQDYLSI